jgi:hypothetical protein
MMNFAPHGDVGEQNAHVNNLLGYVCRDTWPRAQMSMLSS